MQPAEGDTTFLYDGLNLRLGLTGTWASEGVVNNTFRVSQRGAGANFSVDVAGGIAVVTGNDIALQGTYMVISDAVENVVIPSPPVSGERLHEVILHVRDKLYDGTLPDDTYEAVLDVLEDTGGGTPAKPPSAIQLGQIYVAAGQTSVTDADIADIRISALTTPSWLAQVSSQTARPQVPLPGERIWRDDLECMEVATDGAGNWAEIPRRDGGGSAWSTYTPALTGTGGNPNLGATPTRVGRYYRLGRTVHCQVVIKFSASGVSAGSGFYEISLPVPARLQTPGRQAIGSAYTWDNSNTDFADGIAFLDANVGNRVRLSIDSIVVDNNSPWAWAALDELGFTVTYEAAS
jgi:hypothetical protein